MTDKAHRGRTWAKLKALRAELANIKEDLRSPDAKIRPANLKQELLTAQKEHHAAMAAENAKPNSRHIQARPRPGFRGWVRDDANQQYFIGGVLAGFLAGLIGYEVLVSLQSPKYESAAECILENADKAATKNLASAVIRSCHDLYGK